MGQRQGAVARVVNAGVWRGRRVLLTGHTGFKGGWLACWLAEMGAEVTGLALAPATTPSLFATARIGDRLTHIEGDIRDLETVRAAVAVARPEIIFHLAAQPLVRESYRDPIATYAANVMGTVHVLDAARQSPETRAIVAVTSDKCYDNREWVWPYRESDPMGGHDPYSNSKGCAELVASAYRDSYFAPDGRIALATARAGNVIGGGDWSEDRLIPDLLRAHQSNMPLEIRSPDAVRPWQHVLEALNGYLMLGERLLAGDQAVASPFNFGPGEADVRTVRWIADALTVRLGAKPWIDAQGQGPHEATLLKLDSAKARAELGWKPVLGVSDALDMIADWYAAHAAGGDMAAFTAQQIAGYRARLDGDEQGQHG